MAKIAETPYNNCTEHFWVKRKQRKELWVCVFDCLRWHLCHQLSILSMDTCDGSDVFTCLQHLIELRVPQHHHIFVGHEHLEWVHSMLPHQGFHLVTYLITGQRWIESESQSQLSNKKVLICIWNGRQWMWKEKQTESLFVYVHVCVYAHVLDGNEFGRQPEWDHIAFTLVNITVPLRHLPHRRIQ